MNNQEFYRRILELMDRSTRYGIADKKLLNEIGNRIRNDLQKM